MISIQVKRILNYILQFALEVLHLLFKALLDLLYKAWYKFLSLEIPEKIIILNIIASLFAIVLPVARFYIFESFTDISNPAGVYLLGIIIVIFASFYLRGLLKLIIRTSINILYLLWMIYLYFANNLTKANPYELCAGYYLNLIVPSVFIIASGIYFFLCED
jgi:hypothetical protein